MSLIDALDLYLSSHHTADTQHSRIYQDLLELQRAVHSDAVPSDDAALLSTITSASLLSTLRTALDWLVEETRAHMDDENDVRLTAILDRIGQWSALKDAIEQRRVDLAPTAPSDPPTHTSRL